MKVLLHVPVKQFGFVSLELEADKPNIEDMPELYKGISDAFKPKTGLSDKEMDLFVERQLLGEGNHVEDYLKANSEQKKYIQINKRALNRLEDRENKE